MPKSNMKSREVKDIKYYNYNTGNVTKFKEVKEQDISSRITIKLERLNILF